MPQPLPNLRRTLWCCAVRLSQSASASRPPAHVRPSPGCATAPGCAVSRSAIIALCAAFFRLSGLAYGRLIALKAGVLIQNGIAGIAKRFVIGNLLVVDLPPEGWTQAAYRQGLALTHHPFLVPWALLFPTESQAWFLGLC